MIKHCTRLSALSVEITPTIIRVNETRFPIRNITSVSFVDLSGNFALPGVVLKWCFWMFAIPVLIYMLLGILVSPLGILGKPLSLLLWTGMTYFALWLGKQLESWFQTLSPYACEITCGDHSVSLHSSDRILVERAIASIVNAIENADF